MWVTTLSKLIVSNSLSLLAISEGTHGTLLILDEVECIFHLLQLGSACGSPTKTCAVIFLVVIALTLVFEFLGFDEPLNLVHVRESFRLKEFQLLDGLAQQTLLQNTVHQVCVFLG